VIRLESRGKPPMWVSVAVPFGSILLAMVVGGIVLVISGNNPLTTYQNIVQASITQPGAFEQTLISMTPLLFTGLAAAVAFRMRVWNIGGEGQLYMGAVGASGVGLFLHSWPAPLVVLAMVVGGIIAGCLWAAIPGALRAYLNTNEILTSLMLNYVALQFTNYLIFGSHSYWRDVSSPEAQVFPSGKNLEASGNFPGLSIRSLVIPLGLMIGVGLAFVLWGMIRSTKYGFEMRVLGDSPRTAKYAGIRTRRKIMSVMVLSGGIAGLAGVSQVGDFNHVLDPRGMQQAGYGYTGIIVAALARYNPLAVILTSFLIGAITNAGFALQGPHFPTGLTGTLEGILLFCVLGAELFTRYRLRWRPTREAPSDRSPGTGSAIPQPALAGGTPGGEAP